MATSRSLILSVFLSGLCFSAGALFLAAIASRSITIKIDEKPLVTGRVQDLATPYLLAVTGLSLGVGVTTFALLGCQENSRRLNRATEQITKLTQQLHQQEGLVESLKFSEAKLQATGLRFFLDATAASTGAHAAPLNSAALSQSAVAPFPPVIEQVHPPQPGASIHTQTGAISYNPLSQNNHQTSQIEELMTAMQQIMSQIEQLKMAQLSELKGSVDVSM